MRPGYPVSGRIVAVILNCLWISGGWAQTVSADLIGAPVAGLKRGALSGSLEGGITNRELDLGSGAAPDIDLVTAAFVLHYGLHDRLAGSLWLGLADDSFRQLNFRGADLEFHSEPALRYGAGLTVTLYDFGRFVAGGGLQYQRFDLVGLDSLRTSPPADARLRWEEFRFFGGVQLPELPYFVPYGGFYLTVVRGDLEFSPPVTTRVDVEEDQLVGLFYGGDFVFFEPVAFTMELRLIAETSFGLSLRYRF